MLLKLESVCSACNPTTPPMLKTALCASWACLFSTLDPFFSTLSLFFYLIPFFFNFRVGTSCFFNLATLFVHLCFFSESTLITFVPTFPPLFSTLIPSFGTVPSPRRGMARHCTFFLFASLFPCAGFLFSQEATPFAGLYEDDDRESSTSSSLGFSFAPARV